MDLKFDLIGERIKHFREAKNISQEELCAILDISVRHISAIETGTRGISLSLLVDIANALDISSDDILIHNLKNFSSVTSAEWYEIIHDCTLAEKAILMDMLRHMKALLQEHGI
ncbi:helix-turn-helix domain-containing protein [Ruminococcus sp.]